MKRNTARANRTRKPVGKKNIPTLNALVAKESKSRLVLGFVSISFAIYLFTAFISYLFSGKADQSVVNTWHDVGVLASGNEIGNWLGLYGAILAHYFIFKWFGISAFFIPLMLFLWSWYLLFGTQLLSLSSSFAFALFGGGWVALLMGYITYSIADENEMGFFTGELGYELARIIDSLFGWGTILVLILTLLIFIVYFFDVTTLYRKKNNKGSSQAVAATADTESGTTATPENQVHINDSAEEKTTDTPSKIESNGENEATPTISLTVEPTKPESTDNKQEPSFVVEQSDKVEEVAEELKAKQGPYDPTLDLSNFVFPSLNLLDAYNAEEIQVSQEELTQNKDKIVDTLTNFKIGITSIKATIGPTVTLYEIVPEAGVKISRIKNLEDDIALSLAAFGIRIIAPIPGKGTIGIEVPNKNREMVRIKQALSARSFSQSDKELPVALGKTISNETLVVDLAKMPHLLVAGATGQGKSVGLNVILTSLLYKRHPSQLKFILVDPKKVEMSLFAAIERHYLAKMPNSEEAIITDTRKVVHTLNSLCIEMENRYEMMKSAGTRNLKEYNAKFVARRLNPNEGHRFLPYIVLIIDELADLMMTAGKEVETPIARLAQLARAIGIHLVLATQRPSVNVITGVIKANFPARLSFRVTSKVDSRTILDSSGADQLIGHGDMLLSSGSNIIRLQCPFVSTNEVEKVCAFISAQRGYENAYLLPEFEGDDEGGPSSVDLSDRDVFFEEAAKLIVAHQQGSASLIQRKLKLGYNRAGRIIDQLEAAGIVGSFEGSKAREVLIGSEEGLEQLFKDLKEKHTSL